MFLHSHCFVSQSLVEDAAKSKKFSSKPEYDKQQSLNSMENGVNGKDKQNLMVSVEKIFSNVKQNYELLFQGLKWTSEVSNCQLLLQAD